MELSDPGSAQCGQVFIKNNAQGKVPKLQHLTWVRTLFTLVQAYEEEMSGSGSNNGILKARDQTTLNSVILTTRLFTNVCNPAL